MYSQIYAQFSSIQINSIQSNQLIPQVNEEEVARRQGGKEWLTKESEAQLQQALALLKSAVFGLQVCLFCLLFSTSDLVVQPGGGIGSECGAVVNVLASLPLNGMKRLWHPGL